jgi:diguanylate cyclase (GGDEF)-like protein/PAS domain S-box-containing protein
VAGAIDTRFEHILDAISDGVYVTTDDREIVFWSQGAEKITGYKAEEVVGKHCYDNVLVHTDLNGKTLCFDGCPLQGCIETGVDRAVNEVFLKRKDGERLAVYVKTSVLHEADRDYGVEVFGELESVAGRDLVAQVQKLSDSSVTDPLTGLFNRRYLDAALGQQFALFGRMSRRFGVLYLDIDTFKSVNDTLGHAGGDEAIRFVADIISRNARRMDVAARYGGDEFAVICPIGSAAELLLYGRRLVEMVRSSSFAPAEDAGMRLTISAGAALVAEGDADERAVLERADGAMYQAKRSGRDGVAPAASD